MNIKDLEKKFSKMSVAVIGDAMLDVYLTGATERICREAPVPVVSIQKKEEVPGGAANTAVNVAALGVQTTFLTVIGDDIEGSVLTDKMHEAGVNIKHILSDASRQTLAKERIIADTQMVVRFDFDPEKTVSKPTEQVLLEKLDSIYPQVDAIIISDYGYGVITDTVIDKIQQLQKKYKKILSIDSKNLGRFKNIGATLIKPNYEEALALLELPKEQNGKRIRQILSHRMDLYEKTGAHIIAVTLDSEGAVILEKNHTYRTTTQPHDNSKAVGAGDTYISALTLALCASLSTQESADIASLAATCVIQKDNKTAPCTIHDLAHFITGNPKRILSRSDLKELVETYRSQQRRIVFTNGCFDILHPGHVTYLAEAKNLGDILIVGVNTDESVRRLKGPSRPINNEDDRITVLSALACIDHVIEFREDTPIELIKIIKPDIYVKGGDYTRETLPETPIVEHFGGEIHLIPFVVDRSTTNIIKKIRASNQSD